MPRAFLFLLFYCITNEFASAQSGQWIWMKGDSVENTTGHFGTLAVPDPLNTPPGLYEAINWTDNNGNFWLFGGLTYSLTQLYGALWKFDPITNNWTWIKGPSLPDQPGVYGTQGVSDPNNIPGCRGWGS